MAFFKFKHTQHRVYSIVLILLLLFFYVSGSQIIDKNNIELNSAEGIMAAGEVYLKWLGHALVNLKGLTGEAIKMDWKGNQTLEK